MPSENIKHGFFSYFWPGSDHHAWQDFKKLSKIKQFSILLVSFFASALPVFGTCAAFRKMTQILNPKGSAAKTESVVKGVFPQGPILQETSTENVAETAEEKKLEEERLLEEPRKLEEAIQEFTEVFGNNSVNEILIKEFTPEQIDQIIELALLSPSTNRSHRDALGKLKNVNKNLKILEKAIRKEFTDQWHEEGHSGEPPEDYYKGTLNEKHATKFNSAFQTIYHLSIHSETNNPQTSILGILNIYARCFLIVLPNTIERENFLKDAWSIPGACIEGMQSLLQPFLEPYIQTDYYLTPDLNDKTWLQVLGEFDRVLQEYEFLEFHQDFYKEEFNNTDPAHRKRREDFLKGEPNEALQYDLTYHTEKKLLTLITDSQKLPIQTKDRKKKEITVENVEVLVSDYWRRMYPNE